jgi:hypothetical protein
MGNQRSIVVITNGNYFARLILDRLFRERTEQVSGVILVDGDYTGHTGLRALWQVGKRTTVPYTFYKVSLHLVFRLAQRLYPNVWFDVHAMARTLRIPLLRVDKINSSEAFEWVCKHQPALGISVSCPQRIRAKILNIPTQGFLNIHSSLLPEYAGLAPYFWVLAENRTETGVTVHYMTEEFDAGNILVQRRLAIPPATSAFWLFRELALLGSDALMEAVDLALEGMPGTLQDCSRRSYRSHPTRAAYRSLRRNGFVIARFAELYRAVRKTVQQQMEATIPQVSSE